MDCSSPGFSFLGILQASILEWVAIAFSRDSSLPRIKPGFLPWQVDSLPSELPAKQLYYDVFLILSHSLPFSCKLLSRNAHAFVDLFVLFF